MVRCNKCDSIGVIRTSWTPGNPGRRFYCCSKRAKLLKLEKKLPAIQADCDIKATNIILQGPPPEVFALVSNHKVTKELWERIQLLMQGSSLTKQEREFHHNIYSPSSSIPQLEYVPLVNQQPEFSQPELGLIVTVFQKGDDPINAINHMMSFLTAGGRQTSIAAGTSRTYTPRASGNYSGKQRTLSATTAKEKATCPNSAPNQRGKGMIRGLRIKCCWFKLKQVVKFYMRRNLHFLQIQEFQKVAVQNSNYSTQQDDLILSDLFSTFNQQLVDELAEVQNVFYQMEQAVETTSIFAFVKSHECDKCLKLQTRASKDLLKKEKFTIKLFQKGKSFVKWFASFSDNHDLCVLDYINNVNARAKFKSAKKQTKRKVWKPTRKMFTTIGYIWRPTGQTFTIVGNVCPLTRITTTTEAPLRKPVVLDNETSKPAVTLVYSRKPRNSKTNVPVSKSKVLQSVSANKKEPSKSWGSIISDVPSSFLNKCRSSKLSSGTVKFGNDHVAKILGYGDYQIGNVTISRVYYVEGLGHNLFSVGQFCDLNLEVAFRQHTFFLRNFEGVDLLIGSRGKFKLDEKL
ncbi:hypothetical protein Tco_0773332 [Tanacetum coccineum]|uniref:Retrovirus-related Pol polyprotein from transposon TNT 1-94-like beta-barrel domain-containing protein n=1 Tax=Tanacetum coccineum TaxID=301880 RepID=A0ABQ4ZLQ7_9ASTR